MDEFNEVTDRDALSKAVDEANKAAEGYRAKIGKGEQLTGEELTALQEAFDRRDAARARIAELEAADEAALAEQAKLADRFDTDEEGKDAPADKDAAPAAPEADAAPAAPEAQAEVPADALAAALEGMTEFLKKSAEEQAAALTAATSSTTTRPRIPRPEVPRQDQALADLQVTITAASAASGVSLGQEMTIEDVSAFALKQAQRFPKPSGTDPKAPANWQPTPLATFTKEYPRELQIQDGDDSEKVFTFARNESRLQSEQGAGSLIAAGGWCAPSEQLYDLCVVGESLDGMWNSPEVQAKRGGIKYTSGPDFATLRAAIGFHQTEAQAIAGTTKPCYEVPCPGFVEARLEVEGVCIRVPILTYAAYPELVNRILSGAMVVHASRMNAFKLGKVEAASTPKTATDLGSTVESTLRILELRAEYTRQIYRMSFNETLEVVLPHWVLGILKADLRLRNGNDGTTVIDDAAVMRHFNSIGVQPQFVYDWNELVPAGTGGVDYPTSFKVMMYPAGTFVTLTNDVINLSTVYDAASLATNVYTGLFSEEGVQVAKMCALSEVVTIPICSNGTMGASEFTCKPAA